MTVETAHDKVLYVVDVVSEWAETNSAAFLAKENEVVWWSSITGEAEDYAWHRCSPTELARLIKVTKLSHEYMSSIGTDVVITAFQECGRAYLEGIRTPKKVLPGYFNYLEHEVSLEDGYNITLKFVHWFQKNRINPEWMQAKAMLKDIVEDAGLEQPSEQTLNKWMKNACRNLRLTAYHGSTRYKQGGKTYPCIYNKMLRPRQPILVEFPEGLKEKIVAEI